MDALSDAIHKFYRDHPGPLTPHEVKNIEQEYGLAGKQVFSTQGPIGADKSVRLRFNAAVNRGASRWLDRNVRGGPITVGRPPYAT